MDPSVDSRVMLGARTTGKCPIMPLASLRGCFGHLRCSWGQDIGAMTLSDYQNNPSIFCSGGPSLDPSILSSIVSDARTMGQWTDMALGSLRGCSDYLRYV